MAGCAGSAPRPNDPTISPTQGRTIDRNAPPKRSWQLIEDDEIADRRLPLLRPARADAALLGAGPRAERRRLRGGPRLRRLVHPRLPGDPGVGHDPHARPQHRPHRPVPPAQDAERSTASCATRSPASPTAAIPRYVARKAEDYLASTGIADTAYFGPEAEFFVFDDVRFDQTPNSAYYSGRLGRGGVEHRPGRGPQPRLQAPVQGGLLPASRPWTTSRTCGPR